MLFAIHRTKMPPSYVNTCCRLLNNAKSPPNQNPFVENNAPVVFVAAITTQYSGTRKYSATTTRMPVTTICDRGERSSFRRWWAEMDVVSTGSAACRVMGAWIVSPLMRSSPWSRSADRTRPGGSVRLGW
jgi:hypothetical protein